MHTYTCTHSPHTHTHTHTHNTHTHNTHTYTQHTPHTQHTNTHTTHTPHTPTTHTDLSQNVGPYPTPRQDEGIVGPFLQGLLQSGVRDDPDVATALDCFAAGHSSQGDLHLPPQPRSTSVQIFYFLFFLTHFIIPFMKFGQPYLSKATAVHTSSATSACWVFSCFRNPFKL